MVYGRSPHIHCTRTQTGKSYKDNEISKLLSPARDGQQCPDDQFNFMMQQQLSDRLKASYSSFIWNEKKTVTKNKKQCELW